MIWPANFWRNADMDKADVEKKLKMLRSFEMKKQYMLCQIAELEAAKIKLKGKGDIGQHLSGIESEKDKIMNEMEKRTIEHCSTITALKILPEPMSKLLKLRYIEGKTWFEVAEAIDYAESYVRKELRSKALQMMADLME